MLVGLTYDLRDDYLAQGYSREETAEFDEAETIECLEAALGELGYATERIGGACRLVEGLATGRRWDLVFNIAEGLRGFGREAQVPAILEVYGIPYTFSDPLVLALSLHKGMTKRVVRDLGVPTPGFAVVESPEDVERIDLPFPLFAKPVAEGTSKGITPASRAGNREELERTCSALLESFGQPVLVEEYLPGQEYTVGLVGTGREAAVLGVMEVVLQGEAEAEDYSYENKIRWREVATYRLAEGPAARQAAHSALAVWRGLGCRDGGRVDLRADAAGRPSFLELNPLAGLNPHHSDLPILARLAGVEYRELIGRIVESARRRMK